MNMSTNEITIYRFYFEKNSRVLRIIVLCQVFALTLCLPCFSVKSPIIWDWMKFIYKYECWIFNLTWPLYERCTMYLSFHLTSTIWRTSSKRLRLRATTNFDSFSDSFASFWKNVVLFLNYIFGFENNIHYYLYFIVPRGSEPVSKMLRIVTRYLLILNWFSVACIFFIYELNCRWLPSSLFTPMGRKETWGKRAWGFRPWSNTFYLTNIGYENFVYNIFLMREMTKREKVLQQQSCECQNLLR